MTEPEPSSFDDALQNYIRAAIDRKPGHTKRREVAWLQLLASVDEQQQRQPEEPREGP
jgi:hypothetical protein